MGGRHRYEKMSSDKNSKFTPSNLNHPEMMFSTAVVTKLTQSSSTFEQVTTSALRHPAIPESISEEADGLTELYEVMPDLLRPEAVVEDQQFKSYTSRVRKEQVTINARWQHRSNSLPATHGNFILLNREKRPPMPMLSRPSKSRLLSNSSHVMTQ